MNPEDVFEGFEFDLESVAITVRKLDRETVLLEGDRASLTLLGRLILAVADCPDDGYQLGPGGAGAALFTPGSTLGLYIHRA
jgi:hypothetical protein